MVFLRFVSTKKKRKQTTTALQHNKSLSFCSTATSLTLLFFFCLLLLCFLPLLTHAPITKHAHIYSKLTIGYYSFKQQQQQLQQRVVSVKTYLDAFAVALFPCLLKLENGIIVVVVVVALQKSQSSSTTTTNLGYLPHTTVTNSFIKYKLEQSSTHRPIRSLGFFFLLNTVCRRSLYALTYMRSDPSTIKNVT